MTRAMIVSAGSALFGVLLAAGVQKVIWQRVGWSSLVAVGFMLAVAIYFAIRRRQEKSEN